MKFLLIASFPDSVLRFRGPLISELLRRGLDVHVAAPDLLAASSLRTELEGLGVRVHDIPLRRTGLSPLADFTTLLHLWRLMIRVRPDHVLAYTIKPVIYGSLAAWLARVPQRFALITGLGYAFQGNEADWKDQRRVLRSLVERLYRLAVRGTHSVFFQNPDDQALFRSLGILQAGKPSFVLNGSGVDVAVYAATPLPEVLHFLLIGRLLGDKGVREYVQAAHASNVHGPEWAVDYLDSAACDWTPEEIDFVDWVFNASPVLKERAEMMALNEGMTYERNAEKRAPYVQRSLDFIDRIIDTQSKKMVRKVSNRRDVEIWPWDRTSLR